jgi:DNA polymerase lambda
VVACGSYRRGKLLCGDVDILITNKDGTPIKGMMETLVSRLEKEGFLKERLGALKFSKEGAEGY